MPLDKPAAGKQEVLHRADRVGNASVAHHADINCYDKTVREHRELHRTAWKSRKTY